MPRKETLINDARIRRDRRAEVERREAWQKFVKWRSDEIESAIRAIATLLGEEIADAMQLYGDFEPSASHTLDEIDYHGKARALVDFPARRGVPRRVVSLWTATRNGSHEQWLYAQRIEPAAGFSRAVRLNGLSMQETPDAVLALIGDALDARDLNLIDEPETLDQVDEQEIGA